MAQDPVSAVAAWLIPASADVTDKPPATPMNDIDEGERRVREEIRRLRASAAVDDPALALIAELTKLRAATDAAMNRADESFAALPEEIRKPRVPVSFAGEYDGYGYHLTKLGRDGFTSEEDLQRFLAPWRRVRMRFAEEDGKDPEAAVADHDQEIGFDQALAQLRAGLAEIDAAREALGYMAIVRESEELSEQQDRTYDRLTHTKPTTIAGAIAMLELAAADLENRESYEIELVEPALAGLREIAVRFVPELAPRAAHAAVSDHQVETPVIGFGEPGEGGAT